MWILHSIYEITWEVIKNGAIVFGILLGCYVLFRIVSWAIFKSWFEAKKENKQKEEK